MMHIDSKINYKTLFGPVLSRRLGISLGVDLVSHKTCSMDCVYCECGATTHLTTKRKEYVPVDLVKDELAMFLFQEKNIDYITFSGSGEPTLNAGIGDIIRFLKSDYPQYKVALLTNSSFFDQPTVRHQVKSVDVVMASLDAVTEDRFRCVNRPHPMVDLKAIIDGLGAFRKLFSGRLFVEYFLVKGCNDIDEELVEWKSIVKKIQPDGVLLNTLDRPGTEPWVHPVEANRIKDISDFLEGAEIVKYGSASTGKEKGHEDLLIRIVETVRRRPYTAMDLSLIIGLNIEAVQAVLDQLVASRQLATKRMERGLFYVAF